MNLSLATAPSVEPISTANAKAHLRVDTSDDDTLIDALVKAAREQAENFTRRALITQTWDMVLDGWPAGTAMPIPLPPLQSVTHVKYKDQDGSESTFSSGDYIVDTAVEPGRIVLGYNKSWPSGTLYPASPISVRFVAGYGDAATDVPESIIQAMKLMVGLWYEHREDADVMRTYPIPMGAEMLMYSYRNFGW